MLWLTWEARQETFGSQSERQTTKCSELKCPGPTFSLGQHLQAVGVGRQKWWKWTWKVDPLLSRPQQLCLTGQIMLDLVTLSYC